MTLKKHLAGFILLSTVFLASASAANKAQTAGHKSTTAKSAPASQVDINSASEKDLDALPGVGPATAKKIIAGRPYSSASDLSRAGLKPAAIQKLTPLVKVGPAVASPAAATTSDTSTKRAKTAMANTVTTPAPASKPVTTTARASQGSPGPGMVWVNKDTKVYHKQGDRWYGNTKSGQYMSEADAIKAGYHASKGNPAKQ